jgi:hypothetical protein
LHNTEGRPVVPKQVAMFALCTLRTLPNVRFAPESGH